MATSLATKALLGLLGVGAASGTVVVGYKVLKKEKEIPAPKTKKTIAKLIEESGTRVLLTKTDAAGGVEWKASWKLYRTENRASRKGADPWTLNDFAGNYSASGDISEDAAPNSFMEKCVSLSGEEVEDEKDNKYVQVSKWCTKAK